MQQNHTGSCHCGKVQFRANLDLDDCVVCDCSICARKGSIVVKVSNDDFELLTTIDELALYTFNEHIAQHYFCPTCGVHPFNRPRTTPELWAINVRCLHGVDIAALEPKQVHGSMLSTVTPPREVEARRIE